MVGIALRVLPFMGKNVETFMYEINNSLAKIANYMKFYQFSYFSCHAYLKEAFQKVGGFREDLFSCEDLDLSLRVSDLGRYLVIHDSVLWTSPRRLREWSYTGYILKYFTFLFQYYFLDGVNDYYDDLE